MCLLLILLLLGWINTRTVLILRTILKYMVMWLFIKKRYVTWPLYMFWTYFSKFRSSKSTRKHHVINVIQHSGEIYFYVFALGIKMFLHSAFGFVQKAFLSCVQKRKSIFHPCDVFRIEFIVDIFHIMLMASSFCEDFELKYCAANLWLNSASIWCCVWGSPTIMHTSMFWKASKISGRSSLRHQTKICINLKQYLRYLQFKI